MLLFVAAGLLEGEAGTATPSDAAGDMRFASVVLFVIFLGLTLSGIPAFRKAHAAAQRMSDAADLAGAGQEGAVFDANGAPELLPLAASLTRMHVRREQRMAELAAEEELQRSMLDGLGEAVLLVDAGLRVLRANHAFKELWNSGHDPAGATLSMLALDAAALCAVERAFEEQTAVRESFRRADGSAFDVLVRPLPRSAADSQRALALFIDTSRLEALEDLRRRFVADVSHELRTPIAAIAGAIETVRNLPEGERESAERFLAMADRQALRMSALVSDLLDLSQIEVGAVTLDMEGLDVSEVIADVIEPRRAQASKVSVTLQSDVQGAPRILADRHRLEQVLGNLVDNALKFNRAGGSVTLRAVSAEGRVRIEVEDTGRGIPAELLPHVFSRFFRVDKARDRAAGGTGLGLAIVKHLVQLQGGRVSVDSELGRGTCFTLDWQAERGKLSG